VTTTLLVFIILILLFGTGWVFGLIRGALAFVVFLALLGVLLLGA
jgi:hypothetical protein